jgi:hypothetical protein
MEASVEKQRASVRRQSEAIAAAFPRASQMAAGDGFTAPVCDPVPKPQLTRMIDDAANKQGIDPALVL